MSFLFHFCFFESPKIHPKIDLVELKYIEEDQETDMSKKVIFSETMLLSVILENINQQQKMEPSFLKVKKLLMITIVTLLIKMLAIAFIFTKPITAQTIDKHKVKMTM